MNEIKMENSAEAMGAVKGEKNIYAIRNERKKKKDVEVKIKKINRRIQFLLLIILLLSVTSLLVVNSASFYNKGLSNSLFIKHTQFFVIAMIIGYILSRIDYKMYNRPKFILGLLITVGLVLSSIPILAKVAPKIVPRVNGAIGWIRIFGISIQPSEIFKLAYVIVQSFTLSIAEKKGYKDRGIVLSSFFFFTIFAALIMLQNDLGTVIHYFAITVFMIFMSKISDKTIIRVAVAAGGLLATAGIYIYLNLENLTGGYKVGRIKSYLEGLLFNIYDSDKGYQVGQSLLGLGNGGLMGTGYGNGIQKYSYLPEIHTDFIIASLGEEHGFGGVVLLILFFTGLFNQVKASASDCNDYFGKYLSAGIAGMIFLQFLINISVAIGLLPVFGIPMPIISYGGTSLLTIFAALGIVLNINFESKKNTKLMRASLEGED